MLARAAVFLDRDGTINEEVNYLSSVEQFHLLSGAAEAIRRLNHADIPVVVVTNQAGVARGYYDEAQVELVHTYMRALLQKADAHIDAIYFCPHHAEEGIGRYKIDCDCRKPKPGMLKKAAEVLKLDLHASFIVGDKMSDLEAGAAAGCRTALVRTGYGLEIEQQLSDSPLQPDFIAQDLHDAANWILACLRKKE